jgi:uncharacterized protein
MRHQEREIRDRREIDRIIREARVLRLGLCKDNRPYIVPVSFGYDGIFIYFHTAQEGMKIDYMDANDRVCFEMEHDVKMLPEKDKACKWSVSYFCVIGFGRVQEVTATQDKIFALTEIMKQYSRGEWDFDAAVVEKTRLWRIAIEQLTGKRSKDRIMDRPH